MFRPVKVLKISDPLRYAKMTKVRDRRYLEVLELIVDLVSKRPIVPSGTFVHLVIRRTVSQIFESQFLNKPKIFFPQIIMAALFHLIHPNGIAIAALDRRVTVLYPGTEEKSQL